MRILLTGATGVIGRRVVPLLVAAGHEVKAVARTPRREAPLERLGAVPVPIDLFDRESVQRAARGQDAIVNLATHVPRSTLRMMLPGAWRQNDRIRRIAASNLVDAAIGVGVARFVQESFALAYPDCGADWIDEDQRLQPARYNRTLLDAEASAERFTRTGGAGVVLRFAAFYGPDAVQSRDMMAFVRKGWAPLPGAPDAFHSTVSHDDAAAAVAVALGIAPGVYNVVDDEPLTRRAYADALAGALGVAPPRFLPSWVARLAGSMGELMSRSERVSNARLRRASPWRPGFPSAREGWRAIVTAASHAMPAVPGGH